MSLGLSACTADSGTAWLLGVSAPAIATVDPLDQQLRQQLAEQGVGPLDPGPAPEPAKVRLGQALFFDKELSGNRDISCATCHHPTLASGDQLSFAIGTGGLGLGPERLRGAMRPMVPRNATELFNRGSPEWRTMFWDGRVEGTPESGFSAPAEFGGGLLPAGLENILAAQAMFPVLSRAEMRGNARDIDAFGHLNELSLPTNYDMEAIWQGLMARLLAIPAYRELFAAAYPGLSADELGFEHAANALAAFQIDAFTLLDSPWDRYLAGDDAALDEAAKRGALLFYGKANCASCHSGSLLTDQRFYNIAVPQIGPGKGLGNRYYDPGRNRETGNDEDRFAFRTPPLRNVALTGPWMHNGAYLTLKDAVVHHLDPRKALESYHLAQLPVDVQSETEWRQAAIDEMLAAVDPALAAPLALSSQELADLLAFLEALTDPAAADLAHIIPDSAPSGLPVDDSWPEERAFAHVSVEAGIAMLHEPGYQITGQAWGDYDGDGWLDLYLTSGAGHANRLYRNEGGFFSLSPLNEQVALSDQDSAGATFADFDNDGWPDLYVLANGPNVLLRNEAGQGFRDVSQAAGVGDARTSKSAAWGDFDTDGYLDLYVVNWSCIPTCPRPYEGEANSLYRNNGASGGFSDLSHLIRPGRQGAGFVAAWVDYDNDGDLDLYVVNDEFVVRTGNRLWRNDGPGCDGWCFSDVSQESGAGINVMGMGLAVDDFDGDGFLDFYFSNAGEMKLLRNRGDGAFDEVAQEAGVALDRKSVGWGALSLDYDNDGCRDIYLALAMRTSALGPFNPLFRNDCASSGVLAPLTFSDMGRVSGVNDPGPSVGLAAADYDNDGWVDLVVGNYLRGYHLFRNRGAAEGSNRWLSLRLVGGGPVNRDAVGARAIVTTSDGRRQMQEVRNGIGLGGGSALDLHFGLGQAEIEAVEIRWPDGTIQNLIGLAANQRYEIVYESAE